MSSHEIAEWAVFDAIEPFGERRGDIQAGIVAASVWNTVVPMFAKDVKRCSALDYVPDWEEREARTVEADANDQLNKLLFLQQVQNVRLAAAGEVH